MRTRGGEFVPGYLPGLSENDAKVNAEVIEQNTLTLSLSSQLMLSSCPKGTYLLYTTCNELVDTAHITYNIIIICMPYYSYITCTV